MIEIRPNALYARADLVELLGPLGIDADFFIARIKPKKVFARAWFGADLLRALAEAPPLSERAEAPVPPPRNRGNRTARRAAVDALDPLRRLMEPER